MRAVSCRVLGCLLALATLLVLGVPGTVAAAEAAEASEATGAAPKPGAVLETRVLGQSVQGRDIVAYHLGESRPELATVVLIATMHGNEGAPRQILQALRQGPPVWGLDLWVVPTYNPDGYAAGTRRNAHGVDLNRNYPYDWADLDGNYESGPGPASEPETQAMMAFLSDVRPDRILSFHQPLDGVDTDTKRPAFAHRVARRLHLPTHSLTCGGVCHGTMTGWYNHGFAGAALTVEYGASPGRALMRRTAPRQVLSVWGAHASYRSLEPLR